MSANNTNTSFDFFVEQFIAYPKYENYKNVVFTIFWKYVGSYTDPTGKIYSCERIYSTPINTENITNFVEYENLTKNDIASWINNIPELQQYQDDIISSINNQINPPKPSVVFLPCPF